MFYEALSLSLSHLLKMRAKYAFYLFRAILHGLRNPRATFALYIYIVASSYSRNQSTVKRIYIRFSCIAPLEIACVCVCSGFKRALQWNKNKQIIDIYHCTLRTVRKNTFLRFLTKRNIAFHRGARVNKRGKKRIRSVLTLATMYI